MKTQVVQEWPGAEQMVSAHHDHATHVADGVWMSPGLSNSYLVETSDGRVVINTGMGHEAPVHKRVYDAVCESPTRHILLTQGHVDHVGGVDIFREPDTKVIAQANNPACQADDRRINGFRIRRSMPFFMEAVGRHGAGTTRTPRPAQSEPTPDVLFDEAYAFEVGDTRFELLATPGAETIDQLTVWHPQRRIAFVGNVFGALLGHFPNLVTIRGDRYRDPLRVIESADRILALEPEILCYGHFGPLHGKDAIRAEIERVRDAVQFVHDGTVQAMNEGVDLWTCMETLKLPEHLEVGEGYGRLSWSIRAIWEQYAGWFHAERTSELYPIPPSAVWADVVEVAGKDALVARAERYLADDDPVRALHLLEMVLHGDPSNHDARELSLATHEALLARSENF